MTRPPKVGKSLNQPRIGIVVRPKIVVSKVEGLGKIPFLDNILMERWYPVKTVWKLLPWNKENPNCEISVIYVDKDLRIIRDMHGALFVYIRPSIPLLDQTKI